MFYSQFILAKKGPLGTIWIAAHLERKLRKNQVADTDIRVSVDSILFPDVPIALRLSSHLLLGVVRIYNRKVNYLFDDCSEALLKVKQTFRSTAVDLPPEESKAPYHSITLPETFDLDDFELPDNDIFQGKYNDHHISSREQITLQDPMEGVSYSTSKFGLDERFGDGDISELDLDEELFLEKIGSAGNANESADPHASVASMSTLKQDEHTEDRATNSEPMVDVVDGYNDLMDYAKGPCTPGLVEEPNIFNVQEASACDDHLEPEYHLESTVKENSKDILLEDKQEGHWCSRYDKVFDEVPQEMPEENAGQSVVLVINKAVSQGESPIKANTECIPVNETSSVSKLGKVEAIDTALELADNLINSSDALSEGMFAIDPSSVEIFGSEENTCIHQRASPDASEITLENQVGSSMENTETEALHNTTDSSTLNLNVHDKEEAVTETPTLRQCTTTQEQSDVAIDANSDNVALASSMLKETVDLGKEVYATGNSDRSLNENQVQQSVSVEAHRFAFVEVTSQVNRAITRGELVENLSKSVDAELSAPEKLLSVPEGHIDLHRDMLEEFSPGVFEGHDEGDAGSKTVTGKKRTFTESTLTEQGLNSVEFSRQVRVKRTIDSVPDDDDLLSSILVGRKSSVFKVKPTPRLSEVMSLKRTRPTPRSTAPKRKLLMDDTMVLHGDIIREQLTSTEDIRRLRKKAPCTCSEILMIQKQHLGDQIFLEAVITGMSVELASLQSQEYDLSHTSVCQNNETGSFLENLADPILAHLEIVSEPKLASHGENNGASVETLADPHLASEMNENETNHVAERVEGPDNSDETEQSRMVVNIEHLSVNDNEMTKPSVVPLLSENRLDDVGCTSIEVHADQEQINGTEILQREPFLDVAEAGTTSLDADAVNSAAIAGVESLGLSGQETGDTCDASGGMVHRSSFNETSEMNHYADIDLLAGFPYQKTDVPSVELDFADVNDGQVIGRDGVTEKDDGVNGVRETELEGKDVLADMDRDGGGVELGQNARHVELEYCVPGDIYSVPLEEHNMQASLLEEGFMRNGEDAIHPEACEPNTMDAEISGFDLHEQDELNYSAAGNDTDFLNVDDDDLTETADDYMPDAEETRITENIGWSSRTRAVSKYLQTAFIKEADYGNNSLSVDNLLVGKTRKEASRMFFETLVLKTRDYIHVEQWHPFDDITIKPRTKLMKSDF